MEGRESPGRLWIGQWPGEDARRSIVSLKLISLSLIYHRQQRLTGEIAAQVL
jgi:hypothetical protein